MSEQITTVSDRELKMALAHLCVPVTEHGDKFIWFIPGAKRHLEEIQEEEWLHVCWLLEQTFFEPKIIEYREVLSDLLQDETRNGIAISASWQQRATALCRVKGIAI